MSKRLESKHIGHGSFRYHRSRTFRHNNENQQERFDFVKESPAGWAGKASALRTDAMSSDDGTLPAARAPLHVFVFGIEMSGSFPYNIGRALLIQGQLSNPRKVTCCQTTTRMETSPTALYNPRKPIENNQSLVLNTAGVETMLEFNTTIPPGLSSRCTVSEQMSQTINPNVSEVSLGYQPQALECRPTGSLDWSLEPNLV